MFKTTPRSVLFGGDLLRKSAMRVYLDDDGNLQPFLDNLEPEHIDAYDHEVQGNRYKVDRAPTGRQEEGHYHMIDAMLQHIMRLAANNSFSPEDFTREHGIQAIETMIKEHNRNRHTKDQLPSFHDPSWRKVTASSWLGEPEEGQMHPNRAHPRDGTHLIHDATTGGFEEVGNLITVNLKRDDVLHAQADTGQYIDSANQPLFREVKGLMSRMNEYFMSQGLVNAEGAGPFQNHEEHMMDYRDPSVKLSALSSGRVHGIHSKDLDEVLQTGRLPPEDGQRVKMYSDAPYQPSEAFAPEHSTSHGGVHYPAEMLVPDPRSGAPGGARTPAILGFLQQAAEAEHLTDEQRASAADLLQRQDLIPKLEKAPAMTHLFGGGGSKAATKGKQGFGIGKNGKPTYLSRVAAEVGTNQQSINRVHPMIHTEIPEGHATGKQTRGAIQDLHALHAGLTNDLGGDSVEAAKKIRAHGMDKLTPEQQRLADNTRVIADLYSSFHGLENPILGETQRTGGDTSHLYGNVTPDSPALQSVSFGRNQELYPEPIIQTSDIPYIPDINQIQKSFESLQILSAMKDGEVMKYVKKRHSIKSYNDVRSFAMSTGLTTSDVHGIVATKGDWNVVAKQWRVSPLIVKATKVTFGGA